MPAIAAVYTIARVASCSAKDEDWLHDLAVDMFPEDGCLWVYGREDEAVLVFTQFGVKCPQRLIADYRAAGKAPPRTAQPR